MTTNTIPTAERLRARLIEIERELAAPDPRQRLLDVLEAEKRTILAELTRRQGRP